MQNLSRSDHFSRLLVRHPPVMERLRREIVSVLSDQEQPSREQIRKMPYLALVVKESQCVPWSCAQARALLTYRRRPPPVSTRAIEQQDSSQDHCTS